MRCLRPLAVLSIALMSLADCAMASGTPLVGAHAVQIWSAASGKRELSLDENAAIFDVAFSLDGSKLATAGQTGISLWDLASGRKVWQEDDGAVLVVFAPDGKWIAEADFSGKFRLREVATGVLLHIFGYVAARTTVVDFSPDGRLLASAGDDGALRIWDIATGQRVREFLGQNGSISSLAFSPDGRLLAAGGDDAGIRVWNLSTGEEIVRLEAAAQRDRGSTQQGSISALSFSPDGGELAAGNADHTCTIWDLATRETVSVLHGHSYAVTSVRFQPNDGERLVATGSLDHSIKIWDVATGRELRSFTTSEGPISALAFSGDGKHIATATNFAEIGTRERTLHVLSIGIARYRDPKADLRFSVADATAVAHAFQNNSGGAFDRIETHLLLDENASKLQIIGALKQIAEIARPSDTFVFFFSGHNARIDNGSIFVPADGDTQSSDALERTGVSSSVLIRLLARIPAQHQLIILDCYDGGAAFRVMDRGIRQQSPELLELLQRSAAVLTPIGPGYEDVGIGHGLLTYAVLKGLSGGAAKAGVVTAASLLSYVDNTERQLSRELEATETPMSFLSGNDFPLLRVTNLSTHDSNSRESLLHQSHSFPLLDVGYKRSDWTPQAGIQTENDRGIVVAGPPKTSGSTLPPRHDYALIFAGTHYDKNTGWTNLTYPEIDAEAMRDLLHNSYGFGVEIVADADEDKIYTKLREYRTKRKYGPEDQLLVMFSGHGATDDVDGYIVARNSRMSDENFTSYVSFSNLHTILDNMPARHVLLVLDSCFDGAFEPKSISSLSRRPASRYRFAAWHTIPNLRACACSGTGVPSKLSSHDEEQSDREQAIHDKLRFKTRLYLVSGGRQPVPDKSAFIQKFLESLRGAAASDGVLTARQIYSEMEWAVKPEPHQHGFGSDDPWSDFVFEAKKK